MQAPESAGARFPRLSRCPCEHLTHNEKIHVLSSSLARRGKERKRERDERTSEEVAGASVEASAVALVRMVRRGATGAERTALAARVALAETLAETATGATADMAKADMFLFGVLCVLPQRETRGAVIG